MTMLTMRPAPLMVGVLSCLAACSSGSSKPAPEPIVPEVVIGVPPSDDELGFEALDEGATLELGTFSQGGTHITLAIRAIGLGRAGFVVVTVKNEDTGAEVDARTPESGPRPLLCRDENTCDLVPFYVMMAGLTEPDEDKDGLPVEVTASVRNEADESASATIGAVLSTRALPDDY